MEEQTAGSTFQIPDGEKACSTTKQVTVFQHSLTITTVSSVMILLLAKQERLHRSLLLWIKKSYKKECLVKVSKSVYDLVLFAENVKKMFQKSKKMLSSS